MLDAAWRFWLVLVVRFLVFLAVVGVGVVACCECCVSLIMSRFLVLFFLPLPCFLISSFFTAGGGKSDRPVSFSVAFRNVWNNLLARGGALFSLISKRDRITLRSLLDKYDDDDDDAPPRTAKRAVVA